MKNETKLMNCPFCGGEAEILEHDNGWAIWHCIMCKNCKASQEWRKGYTKEEAIDAWNTRKPMERILERLEKVYDVTHENYMKDRDLITLGKKYGLEHAIEIVKEEGVIE